MRRTGRIGLALLVPAAALVWWAASAGPATVYRIVACNFSGIDDHRIFPKRPLHASPRPFRFPERIDATVGSLEIPGRGPLAGMLEESGTVAFVAIKDDAMVFEWYGEGYGRATPSLSFSMAKSVLSLLVGCAVDDGVLRSVDEPVTALVPELAGRGFGAVTLKHLLQMTSGIDYDENDSPFGIHARCYYTDHLEDEILGFRLREAPGTRFVYRSGDAFLLSLALGRALAPRSITDYTQERIWGPLGMEHDGAWCVDREPGGLEKTGCCLVATALDLAKIGRLYLRGGDWDGRRIVSARWVEASTTVDTSAGSSWEYQRMWWLVARDRLQFVAVGHLGQFLFVDPASRAILVRLGRTLGGLDQEEWKRVLALVAGRLR